jgi:GT2 family glycosyltransferase
VSVIVPTYNRRGYLEGTLRSIFEQTIDVHEVILVDDGSEISRRQRRAHRATTQAPSERRPGALGV